MNRIARNFSPIVLMFVVLGGAPAWGDQLYGARIVDAQCSDDGTAELVIENADSAKPFVVSFSECFALSHAYFQKTPRCPYVLANVFFDLGSDVNHPEGANLVSYVDNVTAPQSCE